MIPPPDPGKPFIIGKTELDYFLGMAAEEGMIQTDLAINDAIYAVLDRVAERRRLTPDDLAEAHRERKAMLASERARIAQEGY
ncbi:hypothetical protein [Chryseoglobus sp. 28M-23]|uniref:hypothetical protein n=1 Tax=Chryseoglobus sp. 28M-23 TaxID=2772253 RepID=UPI0017469F71|nr:hypothetical protein [Chryseoglobus sp. 28M-23]QOD92986.1 hypothetical protein IE160_08500 [Chryseoglobus sp. 28M-23]